MIDVRASGHGHGKEQESSSWEGAYTSILVNFRYLLGGDNASVFCVMAADCRDIPRRIGSAGREGKARMSHTVRGKNPGKLRDHKNSGNILEMI